MHNKAWDSDAMRGVVLSGFFMEFTVFRFLNALRPRVHF